MEARQIEFATVDIGTVQPHPKNVRQGDIGAISESLKAHGQYRPIVVDRRTNQILAGNHTWRAAKSLGWSQIAVGFIETKDDDDATRILLADNRTTDLASYDDAGLADLLKELIASDEGLEGTLFDGDALDQLLMDLNQEPLNIEIDSKYSQAVTVPQYEIVGDEPQLSQLVDRTKATSLRNNIYKANLPKDLEEFLLIASARHLVFNYAKIAEFYPHQTPEVQHLMEQSVLIIIDANDAIANGFATFTQTINDLKEQDFNDVE
jgi:hypothetical protein